MKKSPVILYWLLLLVPALLVGMLALYLLDHEADNLRRASEQAVHNRAAALAANVEFLVREARDGLLQSLRSLPRDAELAELIAWQERNPLIRNVFAWDSNDGLLWPDPGGAPTGEETLFARRYEALFSGRVPWENAERDELPDQDYSSRSHFSFRRELRALTKVDVAERESDDSAGGWIPWFSENQLGLLGWVRRGEQIYGLEIEMAALLARLVAGLSAESQDMTFALLSGDGGIMHQVGEVGENQKAIATAAIGPVLPHWQIAIYEAALGMVDGGKTRIVLSILLVAIFVISIVAGGSLLLWQARSSFRDAMQKTSFVSNVSHELKTPLTTIRMYAEMLYEGRVKEEPRKREYLKVLIDQSNRLTRLVNNVLDFSRLEQNRRKYLIEHVELSQLVSRVLDSQAMRIKEAGLSLEPGEFAEASVRTDRDAVEQAVLNLLDNALKYGASGGSVAIEVKAGVHECSIAVLDRGPGVPASHRERVFEKFHRVDDSLTTRHPGCGLGLSIARRQMRELGGDVVYEARPGGGAVFRIVLPAERVLEQVKT